MKTPHVRFWHSRGPQTGLLTLYFILYLYPIATQQPYSAIVCLKVWLVRGVKAAALLSHFPISCVRLLFFFFFSSLLCTYPSPFPLHPSEGLIAYVMSLNICAVLGEVRHAETVQNVPLCTP